MDFVNEERADRAHLKVTVGDNFPFDNYQEWLTEHLHDLMHWATREGVAFSTCLNNARGAWAEEVKPKRRGVSHELDPTNVRVVTQAGVEMLPCIHGTMPTEHCPKCEVMLNEPVNFPNSWWWKYRMPIIATTLLAIVLSGLWFALGVYIFSD